MANQLEKDANDTGATPDDFLVPDLISGVRVMPLLLPKFGLLSADAVREVSDVYVVIAQFRATLLLLRGRPHSNELHTIMPKHKGAVVAKLARSVSERIDGVITILNAEP
jgi:hypothetical protein